MTSKNQIYKCHICGNIVEIVHPGASSLNCCGEPMTLIEEITDKKNEGNEKHFPIIKNNSDNVYTITVGNVVHPMEVAHYIEWIEVITEEGKTEKQFLNPSEIPEAVFCINGKILEIRSYCNVHGLWKSKV